MDGRADVRGCLDNRTRATPWTLSEDGEWDRRRGEREKKQCVNPNKSIYPVHSLLPAGEDTHRQHEAVETGYFASKLLLQPVVLSTRTSPQPPFPRMLNELWAMHQKVILPCRCIKLPTRTLTPVWTAVQTSANLVVQQRDSWYHCGACVWLIYTSVMAPWHCDSNGERFVSVPAASVHR